MSLDVRLTDGRGTGKRVTVTDNGCLCVAASPPSVPEQGSLSSQRFYSALLGSGGAGVTTGMNVDGTTPVEFYISAHKDYDLRIMSIVLILADTAIAHAAFGNISALSNGFDIDVHEGGVITPLVDGAKTGGQLIAQAGFSNAYGNGTTSFELSNWSGGNDAQTAVFPIHQFVPGGIRIGRGTKDKIVATVKDDLTGLTHFTCRVLGYRHYP